MNKINKGAIYEEYICNYINKNNNNITAYLWKNVPDFILFNSKLINDIDDCRINRETCRNYIHDIGIDIIQINNDTNKISFIQCKNYEETLCIKDLAGYFAIMAQSEHYDKEGIIYTSNNKYSHNLIKVCKGNTHKFIHLPMENNIIIPKNLFIPYSYQLECVDKFNDYYKTNNNAILNLPCGCGKTYTSFLLSENYNIVIIISPLKQHTEQNILNFKKYSKKEEIKTIIVDSEGTRNINYILEKIKKHNNIIIGSTYKSCDIIVEIIKKYTNAFIIIDEFHNLSYNNIINNDDNINKIIKSKNKKLYMSATPKIYDLEEDNDYNIEHILGKIVYKMDFNFAIINNYISDYELYLPIHDENNYKLLLEKINIINYENILIKKVLFYFESIKIFGKLKTIIYFNSHEHIDIFIKCFNDVNNYYNYKYNIDSIICSDTKNDRIKKLELFNNSEEISILCSVGILDECIDIPSCDSVYITYNCVSKIRIIQRISRALRKHNNKIAKILIWCENINTINPVISAIKEIDNNIFTKIKYIQYNNKILSLDEQINIQKYNSNKNNNELVNDLNITNELNNKSIKLVRNDTIYDKNDTIYNKNDTIYDKNNFNQFLIKYTSIDENFIDLIDYNFNDEFYNNEFIEDFFSLYSNDNKYNFSVDLDKIAKWMNTRKSDLKETLVNGYKENIDYIITKNKIGKSGAQPETILLTQKCFKLMSMHSKTKKAIQVREYYYELEEIVDKYKEYIIQGLVEKIKKLES